MNTYKHGVLRKFWIDKHDLNELMMDFAKKYRTSKSCISFSVLNSDDLQSNREKEITVTPKHYLTGKIKTAYFLTARRINFNQYEIQFSFIK